MITLSPEVLARVDRHVWIKALGSDRLLAREIAMARMENRSVDVSPYGHLPLGRSEDDLLSHVAFAYEMVVIEGQESLLTPEGDVASREQARAGAFRAFQLRRVMVVHPGTETWIFHVLGLAWSAYVSGCWTEYTDWLKSLDSQCFKAPEQDTSWDRSVLWALFGCWVMMFCDPSEAVGQTVTQSISNLRQEQLQAERLLFDSTEACIHKGLILRLVVMYHWAKVTEIFSESLSGKPAQDMTAFWGRAIEAAKLSDLALSCCLSSLSTLVTLMFQDRYAGKG